ncbi:hypothetical protein H0H93_003244 [Arthromyces matolae]|nr:hypothetical protein H0H93_003244 [Arthromyces matolae]
MVIITGLVPAATLTALKEGLQTLEPIIINREVIDTTIDVSRSEESELFKLISTFIDEGVELLQYRWRPKMVEHDLNDENDALDESDDDFLDQ